MIRLLVTRAVLGGVTLLVTLVLVFVLVRMAPSDPAAVLLRDDATADQIEYVRQLWGLDRPIAEQFVVYVGNLLHGDAGFSYQYRRTSGNTADSGISALSLVVARLPATAQLAGLALLISIAVAIPLGVLTALKQDSFLDHAVLSVSLVLSSFPNFWIGLQLIILVALGLGIVPTGGIGTPQHLILPALTLSAHFCVVLTRLTRTEMVRALRSDYVVTARSKGLSERAVAIRHALRNTLIPLVTVIGLRLGGLLTGAVVVETLFRYPGIGALMIDAIAARDYPIVQVIVPWTAVVFIAMNILVDVLYGVVDPRVRVA